MPRGLARMEQHQPTIAQFPRQGAEAPWRLHQNYVRDVLLLRQGELEDGVMAFVPAAARAEGQAAAAPAAA